MPGPDYQRIRAVVERAKAKGLLDQPPDTRPPLVEPVGPTRRQINAAAQAKRKEQLKALADETRRIWPAWHSPNPAPSTNGDHPASEPLPICPECGQPKVRTYHRCAKCGHMPPA